MLRELVDAFPIGVVLVAAEGRIDYVNRRATELLEAPGMSVGSDELVRMMAGLPAANGRPLALAGQDRPAVVVDCAEGQRTYGFQATRLSNGSRVISFQDITKIEQTQRERDRLLQLASIAEVMPAVLHELKNPLAAIILMMELLIEDAPEAGRERLHAILSEVRRLSLTIDGLGRFNHEVRSTRHWAIDLALREAFALLAPQAEARGLVATLDLKDMPLLPFEPAAIRAVLFNLVTNAIHACQAGERIAVHADFDRETSVLTLTVADTGRGMAPEVRARCTELFYTTKAKGSGIGLALCAGVAEAVGGSLSIESKPGEGTRISLTFPVLPRRS